MSLMSKLKKNSTIEETAILVESDLFNGKTCTPTDVPMMNVALSGDLNGGLLSGLTVLAGPSKHFKTSFALKMASAFMKDPEAIMLFYDSEFGSPEGYFNSFGIDTDRVLHCPITNVEELKIDIMAQLENLDKDDKVLIVIDSIGNLASKKEVDDALEGKSVADMSRAKALKGVFRMITPHLSMKNFPLLAINHTYKEIGLYPKDVVGGGTGIYYSSDTIWILGRRQIKTGTEVTGYDFVINVEKSRFVKEKSQIPITVSWEGGIERFSGLLDLAVAGGFIVKPSNGWYQLVDRESGEAVGTKVRAKDTLNEEYWSDLLADEEFNNFVQSTYRIDKRPTVSLEFDMEE